MSHPYGSTSNPSTPIDVSAWGTIENQQGQEMSQHQQQQDTTSATTQHQQFEQQQFSPTNPVPQIPPAAYQTVQLEPFEAPQRVVPSQTRQGGYDNAPIALHPAPGAGRQSLRASELSHPEATQSAGSSAYASTSSSLGPHRTQQRHMHRATGPYEQARRPQSASHVQFAPATRYGETSRNSPMSPVVPSPASTSRIASHGSTAGTPRNVSPDIQAASRTNLPSGANPSLREKPWLPRTDTHYDAETQTLTLMLNLPGVKKSETRVTLSTCRFNRLRQIKVSGYLSSRLPCMRPDIESEQGMIVRERTTYGPFNRVFAVPTETKREDIQATMEDGVLTIKIPQGPPVEENPEEISIY